MERPTLDSRLPMPLLIADRQRHELRPGTNVLGGIGPDAIDIADLASLPRVAIITVVRNTATTIQRLSPKIVVRLNGETLGAPTRELLEGSEIEIGGFRLRYTEASASEQGIRPAAAGTKPKASELATEVLPAVSAPGRPARLVALATGRSIRIVGTSMTLGRSEECNVVLAGRGLSRQHAVIRPDGASYAITDESTNGTFVNGERVIGNRTLQPGDILALGEEQFRFEFDEPVAVRARDAGATSVMPDMQRPALAELEITEGVEKKRTHRIDRPVCSIGRGKQNDIHLGHESVSASHASLLLKGDVWYLTDLHSANGTYVDGYRIAGERALSPGCTIRMGKVGMTFRPARGGVAAGDGTQPVGGLLRRIADVLSPHRD